MLLFLRQLEMSEVELKILFSGHADVFTEVQDKMSLSPTEVSDFIHVAYSSSDSHFTPNNSRERTTQCQF